MKQSKKNRKGPSPILIIFITGICIYLAFVYVMGNAKNWGPKIKLSTAEKKLIKELKKQCDCKVEFRHNYSLINNMRTNYDAEDSTLLISFSWKGDLGSKKNINNICNEDSIFLRAYASVVVSKLVNVISYEEYYSQAKVFYYSYEYSGRGLVNATCSKSVVLELSEMGGDK